MIAVLLAVLLGLFFAPAAVAGPQKTPDQTPNDHPSGRDRSDKPSDGETQGKSTSDPDGDSNGGADKPGISGGFDDDKDGNNGCGNDDDFEDDNNGWCGGKPKANAADNAAVKSNNAQRSSANANGNVHANRLAAFESRWAELSKHSVNLSTVETGEWGAQVLGVSMVRTLADTNTNAASVVGADAVGADGEVLGSSATTGAAAAGTLARTGRNLLNMAALALALCNIGGVMMLMANRRELEPLRLRAGR